MPWKATITSALRSLLQRSSNTAKPVAFIDHDGSVVPPQGQDSTLTNDRWQTCKAQVRSLLAEAMVRAGAMTNQYKVWINPVNNQVDTVSVMIRLDPSLSLNEEPQIQVEEFLIEHAKEKHQIDICDIHWLSDTRTMRQSKKKRSVDYRLDIPLPSRPHTEK
ncbi:hypothetical protein E9531_09145 [Lampropedia puyangensis]|uniref:Uncharacterized protein n=1 Tax=Lampropedia puyangensis TaxID=1330072 RepID=A0A4S8F2I7_9BURK|nr:hypothetical protein [Lampropedia puyangensis]THU01520.1 hypothetical protein E9531_09145 [Lampropedia puyangensis]